MPLLVRDPELLARFRRGDPAALERVYREYVDRVERVVRYGFQLAAGKQRGPVHVAGAQKDEVADLLQEVFTRAFAERARLAYDGQREYGPFLLTIARNLLVDRARRLGRELSLDALEAEPPAPEEEAAWADDSTMKAVNAYLASLPEELRGVHEQRYVRCVSQEEAAAELRLTRQRVRTLERKLRDGLAAELARAGLHVGEEHQPDPAALRMAKKGT